MKAVVRNLIGYLVTMAILYAIFTEVINDINFHHWPAAARWIYGGLTFIFFVFMCAFINDEWDD